MTTDRRLDQILEDHLRQLRADPGHYLRTVADPTDQRVSWPPMQPRQLHGIIGNLAGEIAELRTTLTAIANGDTADPAAAATEVLTRTDPLRDAT